VVRHRGDTPHLVLHRRDRLGILRHSRVGDDDRRPRRLGVETAGRHDQLARRRRVHILLWDPRQLFEASFQLSFFVVLVIVLMLPPLNKISDRLWQSDPLLPAELLPRWRRVLIATLRILSRYFALSFAAWVGSIPLAAKYFHLFSPVSTPANIVAVPLGTLALMSNLGSLVCGTCSVGDGIVQSQCVVFHVGDDSGERIRDKNSRRIFYVPAPSWLEIGIYYAVLVGALSGWLFAPKQESGARPPWF